MKTSDIPKTGTMWAACACGQPIYVVDVWLADRPPIPRVTIIRFYFDEGCDPDEQLVECPRCDEWLDLEVLTCSPK